LVTTKETTTIIFSGKGYLTIGAQDSTYLSGKDKGKANPNQRQKSKTSKIHSEFSTLMMKWYNLMKITK
jgi:hypothetical protein